MFNASAESNQQWNEAENYPQFTTESLEFIIQGFQVSAPCGTTENPEYLAHLNTPNVARDLDLIRNLTGFETMDYFGWDYGNVIGVNYAALFPERVGHMLLDCTQPSEMSSSYSRDGLRKLDERFWQCSRLLLQLIFQSS